jgi:8-amino-3,8-dideoxy-alpha-D-manno-octulosonate transaminase
MTAEVEQLAICGGPPAKRTPALPMYPGGMAIGQEEEDAVIDLIRRKRLFRYSGLDSDPSKVLELEEAFARHTGVHYTRAVTSATAALICSLVAAGIGPGDEVIVPAFTWIATANAVITVGGIPVIAEVDRSLTLDPDDVRRKLTTRTRAIIPVHMRGAPAAMDAIMAIAAERGLAVIEDVAQAVGGSYRGKRLGSIGHLGAFSFQYNKIITTGEGGMITTNDRDLWARASAYHDPTYIGDERDPRLPELPPLPGQNYRASEIMGALGLVQLGRLEGLLARMRERKRRIRAGLAGFPGIELRSIHDEAGDTAICVIMFLPTADAALKLSFALGAENVRSYLLYHPNLVDHHVYAHWETVLSKASCSAANFPWGPAFYSGNVAYSKEMCPRTLDLLGRAVHIDVNPLLTDEDVEGTIAAVQKVTRTIL